MEVRMRLSLPLAALALVLSACSTEREFERWDASEIIDGLQVAGAPVGPVRAIYTEELEPQGIPASTAMEFEVPRVCDECFGKVFAFASEEDLFRGHAAIDRILEGSNPPSPWIYEKDNVIVLIDGQVPESWALKYEESLAGLTPIDAWFCLYMTIAALLFTGGSILAARAMGRLWDKAHRKEHLRKMQESITEIRSHERQPD